MSFSPRMSGSPVPNSNGSTSAVNFEILFKQLGECHQNSLQELEAKVAKLKKERCLDAQRLEVFYNRNQQLKEQNKTLQDTISGLEERLRDGECERCAILEDNLKTSQEQNADLINKLEHGKKALIDENKMLHLELEKLKRAVSCSDRQRSSSSEMDDGFIPDSPVMASSLPAANKLKKRKNKEKSMFVRYVERPLAPAHTSLFLEAETDQNAVENPVKSEVLVPNTCELDASQADEDLSSEEFIAETCRLDLMPHRVTKQMVGSKQQSPESSFRSRVLTKSSLMADSPDSTTNRSPSLLPGTKRFSENCLSNSNMAKRKKEESQQDDKEGQQEVDQEVERRVFQSMRPNLEQSTLLKDRSFKSHSNQDETLTERPTVSSVSPVFKKPNRTVTQKDERNRPPLKDQNKSQTENSPREFKVEPMWSIDPALALEMYESEQVPDEEEKYDPLHAESMDSDCTWVSHSVLQGRAKNKDEKNYVSGLGDKANDSLDRLFDTSACGDYKSYTTIHVEDNDQTNGEEAVDGEEEEEEEEEEGDDGEDNDENSFNRRKPGQPTFAHVAVIRKKEERRKLKGTTCKECEIYYAHLPEDQRQKKLSNCSRHRFLYIPPCTPENFWEVGFPSTQTCIERGYIKEDKNPQCRSRRRQPLNALFSPKGKKKENGSQYH